MEHAFFKMMGISGWMALVTAFMMAVGYDPNNNGYRLLIWIIICFIATVIVARSEGKAREWISRQFQRNKTQS